MHESDEFTTHLLTHVHITVTSSASLWADFESDRGLAVSFSKERTGTVSGTKPYKLTLPYHVIRFNSFPSSYVFTDVGGWTRVETGNFLAVSRDRAIGMLNAPGIGDAVERASVDAQNACFDRLASVQWNTPVFFAELHKSTELVAAFAHKVDSSFRTIMRLKRNPRRALRDIRKTFGRYAQGFKVPKGVTSDTAKLWLQWRYAVQTGVLDIESAAKATASLLLDKSNQAPDVIESRKTIVVELPTLSIPDGEWGRDIGLGLSLGANVTHQLYSSAEVTAKAWFTAWRRNSFLTDANQLGLLNAPVVAWELTPLSFVADWILDVGNFMERCTAAMGYELRNGGQSVLRRVGGEHKVDIHYYGGNVRSFTNATDPMYEISDYNRNGWSSPTPTWTPRMRMSTNRWLDAAALIRQIPLGRFKIV